MQPGNNNSRTNKLAKMIATGKSVEQIREEETARHDELDPSCCFLCKRRPKDLSALAFFDQAGVIGYKLEFNYLEFRVDWGAIKSLVFVLCPECYVLLTGVSSRKFTRHELCLVKFPPLDEG